MSRTARRTLSWLFTLALVVVAVIGWNHLPGSGGVLDELRWLLARDKIAPQHFNRAAGLLQFAEEQMPGRRCGLLTALLLDEDPRVEGAALVLLGDRVVRGAFDTILAPGVRPAFAAWFKQATVEEKLARIDLILDCMMSVYERDPTGVPKPSNVQLTRDDLRWMVAGTLQQGARRTTLNWLLSRPPLGWGEIPLRLRLWDDPRDAHDESAAAKKQPPLDADTMAAELRPSVDLLAALLSDPIEEVRWAAGRIFVVCGDERGLPAVYDWLKTGPTVSRRWNRLLETHYGADWRKPFESSSPTSQPGAGDGGG